jgi:3-methyladenine DNA glycosylase AlkC
MAPPLKDQINASTIAEVGTRFAAAYVGCDVSRFQRRAARGLASMELLDRARHVAAALDRELPAGDEALDVFEAALGAELDGPALGGMAYFIHSAWLTERAKTAGFDRAMTAAEALTRRFTAEFAVRPLLERDPERAVAWLQAWARSPNVHVRRLVSEGTRPRLPWAPRLTVFAGAYAPLLELLDLLRRDPELYVRRSVANHLGDLAKDDLPLALDVAAAWMRTADQHTPWVVRHGLRHPLKEGHAAALALMGHAGDPQLTVRLTVSPTRAAAGDTVEIRSVVHNPHEQERRARADLAVAFPAKAGGRARTRVFRLPDIALAAGGEGLLSHRLKMVPLSTRPLHPGAHRATLKLNGVEVAEVSFDLLP